MSSWSGHCTLVASCFLVLCSGKWSHPTNIFHPPCSGCGGAAALLVTLYDAVCVLRCGIAHLCSSLRCVYRCHRARVAWLLSRAGSWKGPAASRSVSCPFEHAPTALGCERVCSSFAFMGSYQVIYTSL